MSTPIAFQRPRRAGRVVIVLFALVCLVVSGIAVRWSENAPPHHIVTAELGEPFVLGAARVTIDGFEVGDVLADNQGNPVARTEGVFVAIDLTLVRLDDRRQPSDVTLVTPERTYEAWDNHVIPLVDVGYQASPRVIMEIDPADLGRLAVQVFMTEVIGGYGRRVEVSLDIGPRAAAILDVARGQAVRQQRAVPEVAHE